MKSSLSISRLHRAVRSGLVGAALAAVLAAASLPGLAADPVVDPTPDAMILSLSSEVLGAIRNDKAIQAGDFDRVQKLVDERILPLVDFDKMTRIAVGRAWRTASVEQRERLKAEFRLLLLRTYSGALSKVTDYKVRLRPSRGQDSPTDAVVRTQIVPSQGDPIDLDFRLNKADAGWKIYDVDIMGVWLAENYKNEFAEILNQGGIDALIKSLAEKNQKPAMTAKTA